MTARKNQKSIPQAGIHQLTAVSAERLLAPLGPRELYLELLAMKHDEAGSIDQIATALIAEDVPKLPEGVNPPGDAYELMERLTDMALAAGADTESVNRLSAAFEDAQILEVRYGQEAGFVIGFACGLHRAHGVVR